MSCTITGPRPGRLVNYTFEDGTPGGNNSTVAVAKDTSGKGNHGALKDFALQGGLSNWSTSKGLGVGGTCGP